MTIPTPELPDRDRRIVTLIARFGQVTSNQLHALLFFDTTKTPVDRALRRLVANSYLIRIEQRRLVGGARGGGGQYVYSLGRRGFFMFFEGRYVPTRSVRYHSLAIVDVVVALRQLERAGRVSVIGMASEPDCWTVIGGQELKPDLLVELERSDRTLKLFIEVDMGSEGQKQLRSKLERYWLAYNHADSSEWPEFPGVLWAAIDEERVRELRWVISQLPSDSQPLFQVVELSELPSLFG